MGAPAGETGDVAGTVDTSAMIDNINDKESELAQALADLSTKENPTMGDFLNVQILASELARQVESFSNTYSSLTTAQRAITQNMK